MRVPLTWLSDYVALTLPPEELARRLTLSSAEVEEIVRQGGDWDRVRIGEVLRVEPHPNADKLRLVTVNLGDRQQRVVCGAPNVAEGQRIAFGEVGAHLINGHTGEPMELRPAKIRGVESAGMVLSERELGISEDHEGILVLPPTAPVGTPLRDYLGEIVFDMAAWANRPDLLSIIGVAREVAALTGQAVHEPEIAYQPAGDPAERRLAVDILDPDLCSRYIGMVIEGVTIGPSPTWMQERLTAAGMRPINTVVDITNYVMLEYGQPLHAFDYDKVGGRRIVVRRARSGETLVTIDGERRELSPEMLVIADDERPVALAGVMGGQDSEVSDATTTVLLEAATFNGTSIRRTAQRLKMRSEASARFEKGLPSELAAVAARRAARLLAELAGGRVAPGMVDAYPVRPAPASVDVPAARLRQVLGIEVPPATVETVLTALGFAVERRPDGMYHVDVPYWRPDVRIPDDIAEEVIRIVGYEDLPLTTVLGRIPPPLSQQQRELRERVKDILAAAGMQEIMTYSAVSLPLLETVVSPDELRRAAPLRLVNPLSTEHEYMRTSLRGSALATLGRNLRTRRGAIALFETANVYIPRAPAGDGACELPYEQETLVGVIGGQRTDRWGQPSGEPVDFFDAKGYAEALFSHLHLTVEWAATEEFGLLPGRTAAIRSNGEELGVVGQVHPEVAEALGIDGDVFLFEVRLDRLAPLLARVPGYRPYATTPTVEQDLAVLVDANMPAADVQRLILDGRYVVSARLFDEYTGERVPEGKKSLAFAVSFQASDRTLTDEEVARARARLVATLERRLGATLRA